MLFVSGIQQDELDRSISLPGFKNNLYDSLRQGGNMSSSNMTSVMEGLQSQLKQKDGEIMQLQVRIGMYQKMNNIQWIEKMKMIQIIGKLILCSDLVKLEYFLMEIHHHI